MVHVAVAQIRPTKADYADNLGRIGSVLENISSWQRPADVVVFPESAMSGYFLEGGVREVAVPAGTLFRDLVDQHDQVRAPPMDVVLGFYEEHANRYYNSALYASLGGNDAGVRHVHRKVFLPTYGVFDEQRFVDRGRSVSAFDTRWGRAGMLVCEDAWHSITGMLAALDGAQVLFVTSAAPARGATPERDAPEGARSRPASVVRWERLVQHIAEEHGVYVVLAQLVGFEGGKGLQGGSTIVAPDGDVVVTGPVFDEGVIEAEIDLEAITRARVEQPLLADLEVQLLNLLRSVDGDRRASVIGPPSTSRHRPGAEPADMADVPPLPSRGGDEPLELDCELAAQWLVAFLRDEIVRRRGFSKGVVGLSGGVDSALTATLAARALGPENVVGLRMPYTSSSPESLAHAALVAQWLGIRLETVDITEAVDGYLRAADPSASPLRRGNVMARLRMVTLFDFSAKYEALPLGTGNKTERLLGYFTWHADDSPPVNPLGDLFKTQVWQLARHLAVPDEILSKPPTADLEEGQTDESDLGISYERADHILHGLLRGLRPDQLAALGFTGHEVELVQGRLEGTHWKRRLPTVAMLSRTAIGESYLRPVDY
jgi:NAD+ synthetase